MKRRPPPVLYASHQAMLPRVPMDVIDASLQIVLILNRVLPVSLLPNASIPLAATRLGLPQFATTGFQPRFRELFFDAHPAHGITVVAGRQRPDGVPMIWQQHN